MLCKQWAIHCEAMDVARSAPQVVHYHADVIYLFPQLGIKKGAWGSWYSGLGLHQLVSVQSMGEMGKDFCPNFLQPFLENIDKGAVTTEARSLFQYFKTLTENVDPLLRRWLAPWSTLKGCPLRARRAGGRKTKFGSISKRTLNILKAVIRSA